jgi:hypothetical protein
VSKVPVQPARIYPLEGEGERVTVVPYVNDAEQVPGQEMPEGVLVTVPLPVTFTVSVCGGFDVNVVVTLAGLFVVSVQVDIRW